MKIPSQEEFEKLIKPFLEKNNIDPKDCKYVPHAYGFKNDNFRIYKDESKYHLFLLKAYDGEYKKDEGKIYYIAKDLLKDRFSLSSELFIHIDCLYPVKILTTSDLIKQEPIKELTQANILQNILEKYISGTKEEYHLLNEIIKHSENGLKF
jgi:hypothetical protein